MVRNEWEQLPEDHDMKLLAHRESEASKASARQGKLARKSSDDAPALVQPSPSGALADIAPIVGANVARDPLPLVLACSSGCDVCEVIGKPLPAIAPPLLAGAAKSEFPLAVSHCSVEDVYEKNFNKSWQHWGQISSAMPQNSDVSGFPARVTYRRPCGPISRVHDDPNLLKFHQLVVGKFEALLKKGGSQFGFFEWTCGLKGVTMA